MTFKAFFLILSRQISQKWGRFLLASAGIMIGVWAILLTTGLSFGVLETIIKAINSQPIAKQINIYKLEGGKTSFFEVDSAPKFISLSKDEVNSLKSKNNKISSISPSEILTIYWHTDINDKTTKCSEGLNTNLNTNISNIDIQQSSLNNSETSFNITNNQLNSKEKEELFKKCREIAIPSNVFQNFYENNRVNWYGKKEEPTKGEIATCYKCGDIDLYKKYNINKPEDLIGKKMYIELSIAPDTQKVGEVFDVLKTRRNPKTITESKIIELEIVSVIDDRENSGLSFTGGSNNNFYLNFGYFEDAIKLADPNVDINNVGYIEWIIFLDSYDSLQNVVNFIRDNGYVAFSLIEGVIGGISVVFYVLAGVLALFGFIALIASLFGIVNVMIISVLERKKEIGVLKSIGSKNRDIFILFLLESSFLGFLGWLLGTIFALLSGWGISLIFETYLNSDQNFRNNLENLNINNFNPYFPWWSLLATLVISLLFTSISGIYPAVKASNQNPTEVLRSE